MNRPFSRIVTAFLTVGLSLAAAKEKPETVRELPFEFKTRQPIVAVRINGGDPVPFVVDTGSSINVIDSAVARAGGVVAGEETRLTGGGQGAVVARSVEGVMFETGAVSWRDQKAALLALGYPTVKHYAGLLGAPILSAYVVQFDFPAQVLRLIDPGTFKPSRKAVKVPFVLQDGLPLVSATVDTGGGAVTARLSVDTGAGDVFIDLNRPFVDAHDLLEGVTDGKRTARKAGIGGVAPFVYGTGRRVVLGGIVFDNPKLGFSRSDKGSSSTSKRDGIIGNDLLAGFVVTIDYGKRVLFLERRN